jgi:hypothetical protein
MAVRFVFPRWTNKIPAIIGISVPVVLVGAVGVVAYTFSPNFTDVGYAPLQPVPFSHALHAGEVGLDCRYCHNTVEEAGHAAVPATATCMNCHRHIATDSVKLAPVREAYATGAPIEWINVHMLPDYSFFNHSVHVAAGVGCASCHGRIDQMEIVQQDQPLSMGWCLDCHRNPDPHLRPLDQVTNMEYDPVAAGYDWRNDPQRKGRHELNPPVHCSGCHR